MAQVRDKIALGRNLPINSLKFGTYKIIGDSMAQNGLGQSGFNTTYFHQRGAFNWLQALTGYKYSHEVRYNGAIPYDGDNKGVGGEKTYDFQARLSNDVLSDGQFSVLEIISWTNDLTANRSAESIVSNLKNLAEAAIPFCSAVAITTDPPRHNDYGFALTVDQEAERVAANALIRQYAADTEFIVLYDIDKDFDPTGSGVLSSDLSYDGVHEGEVGARRRAAVMMKALGLSQNDITYRQPEDYDATNNPYGNIAPNSVFDGTGGTLSTGTSGTLPDDWRAERSAGSNITAEYSIVDRKALNGETVKFIKQVITCDGLGSGDDEMRVRPTSTYLTDDLTVGEWYVGEYEIHVDATDVSNFMRSRWLDVKEEAGVNDTRKRCMTKAYTYSGGITVKDYCDDGSLKAVFRTPALKLDDVTSGITFYMLSQWDASVAGSRTLYLGRPTYRKLAVAPPTLLVNNPASLSVGFADYNDATTATTPISITGGAGFTKLTNDGAGSSTNLASLPDGISSDLWDTTNNRFDWSGAGLVLGDEFDVRIHVQYTTTANNQEVDIEILMAANGVSYDLIVGSSVFKFSGVHEITYPLVGGYMGDNNTLNNYAEIRVSSPDDIDVKVSGWYIRIYKK